MTWLNADKYIQEHTVHAPCAKRTNIAIWFFFRLFVCFKMLLVVVIIFLSIKYSSSSVDHQIVVALCCVAQMCGSTWPSNILCWSIVFISHLAIDNHFLISLELLVHTSRMYTIASIYGLFYCMLRSVWFTFAFCICR